MKSSQLTEKFCSISDIFIFLIIYKHTQNSNRQTLPLADAYISNYRYMPISGACPINEHPPYCASIASRGKNHLSVCLSVYLAVRNAYRSWRRPQFFVRSSSNLECRLPMWQRRVSSMAN